MIARLGADEFVLVRPAIARRAGGAAAGQVAAGRAGAAVADRRPGDRGQRQRRRDHVAERSRLGRARAAHGRHGDDPRQGGRPLGAALLRAGHGCAAPGAQGARARHGQGDRESRVRGVLSAQAERAHARAVRRRGADPLAPSAAWADRTGPVHPGGRGDPHDRPDRPLGARAGLPRRRRVGRRPGGGQPVAGPVHRRRPAGHGGEGAPASPACRRPSSRSRSPRACCSPTTPAPTR